MDLPITYNVPGVPDLTLGVTDTGHAVLMIATESVIISDPAGLAAIQQGLEQIRVDQNRIYEERFPREPDTNGLGPNQIGIMRSLSGVSMASRTARFSERPYPGGGWIWDTDSRTRVLLNSLVRRRLVSKDGDGHYRLTDAGHDVMAAHVPDYETRRRKTSD
jgi:hypothetical protein